MFINALLILFLAVVLAFGATFIMHLVIRVPFVPTPMPTVRAMVEMADLRDGQVVMDLGAGDGRLVQEAVTRYPGVQGIGVELVPTVWMWGWLRTRKTGRVRFLLGNALTADLTGVDVVFLYMMPHIMEQLEYKFDRELQPGAVVVSNAFRFPNWQPEREEKVNGKTVLRYVWDKAKNKAKAKDKVEI